MAYRYLTHRPILYQILGTWDLLVFKPQPERPLAVKSNFFKVFVRIWQVRCQKKRNDLYSTYIKFRDQILDNKAIVTRYAVPTLNQIRRILPISTYYKPIKDIICAWNIHTFQISAQYLMKL